MISQKTITKSLNTCHKHSKSRADQVSTRVPTIKCHEEVMSKLSSCTNEDCVGDPNSCVDQFCHHRKETLKKDKVKTVMSKCKLGLHPSVSNPGTRLSGQRHKDVHRPTKTMKSQSFPTVQSPNLEDSVDFIPVKLTANERKQRPQKRVRHNFESRLGFKVKTTKPFRPTWDEILRNNLEVSSRTEKNPPKKSLQADNKKNFTHSEHSSARTLRKDSPKKPENCHGRKDIRQNSLKQTSECSRSTESLNSGKTPQFQHINSSDPFKTLDFLIKQLRDGLLVQPQNERLQNIIQDMENALLKISVNKKSESHHQLDRESVGKEDLAINVPQSAVTSCNSEKIKFKRVDIMELQQTLENSCRYLQSLCIKQKESCSNHLREKEQLSLQLAESRRLLACSKSKEKNYEVTIGELRLKLQEANSKIDQLKQSLQDVENKNATLKEENQTLASVKESMKRIGVRLKQISSEKEKLQSKLSLKDLEIEKLKVLLQMKTNQKTDSQKEDNTLLAGENEVEEKIPEENDLSIISLSTVTSFSERPGLVCSSQASSSPRRSPSPYNSWQHMSSIVQQPSTAADINRGIAILLQDLKKKSKQLEPLQLELQNPSSCSSLWSDQEVVDNKVVYSDGESEGFSS